jgi:hypothetical protein
MLPRRSRKRLRWILSDQDTRCPRCQTISVIHTAPKLERTNGVVDTRQIVARALTAGSIRVSWSGSDPGTTHYEVQCSDRLFGMPGAAVLVLTRSAEATHATSVEVSGLSPNTRYYFRVRALVAKDGGACIDVGEWSDVAAVSTWSRIRLPVRINAGGSDTSSLNGAFFAADHGYLGGAPVTNPEPRNISTLRPLCRQRREGPVFGYALYVPNGRYLLTLLFHDPTSTATDQRRFDVYMQDERALAGFDIFAAGGAASAVVSRTMKVMVTSGRIDLSFVGRVGKATVSALQLLPY